MADDDEKNNSNSSKTTMENTTNKETDMPGKEFEISRVQDSEDKIRGPRLRG